MEVPPSASSFSTGKFHRERSSRSGASKHSKERLMERLQAFQTAARKIGFVEVKESETRTVLWLRKNGPATAPETHQRMCIDSVTNSVTVYWMTVPSKVNSKTFRGVPALQEWFELRLEPEPGADYRSSNAAQRRNKKALDITSSARNRRGLSPLSHRCPWQHR